MKILNYSLVLFFAIQVISVIVYIPRIKLWFVGLKAQKRLKNTNKSEFALIIPARNESKITRKLFESIKGQTYDKDKFDVYVIVENENDKTVEYAKEILPNGVVWVLPNQIRKAEALDFCFKNILKKDAEKYDDFIIIDADNLLTPDFLEEMNNALVSGADIVIPRKVAKNWQTKDKKFRSVYTNCSASTFVGVDAMGNKGKCLKGDVLALCGQGMLISARVIKGLNGYPFRSLVEDYEIAMECIRKGYKQFYYEHAIIYSEEPVKRKEFNKRRMRWIKGFSQCNKLYNKELRALKRSDKKIRKETYFFRTSGVLPVYVMFVSAGVFLFAYLISALVLAITSNQIYIACLWGALACFSNMYLQLLIYGVFILFEDRDVNKMTVFEKIKFVLLYPVITMGYLWVFFVAFTTKKDFITWKPVERLDI